MARGRGDCAQVSGGKQLLYGRRETVAEQQEQATLRAEIEGMNDGGLITRAKRLRQAPRLREQFVLDEGKEWIVLAGPEITTERADATTNRGPRTIRLALGVGPGKLFDGEDCFQCMTFDTHGAQRERRECQSLTHALEQLNEIRTNLITLGILEDPDAAPAWTREQVLEQLASAPRSEA